MSGKREDLNGTAPGEMEKLAWPVLNTGRIPIPEGRKLRRRKTIRLSSCGLLDGLRRFTGPTEDGNGYDIPGDAELISVSVSAVDLVELVLCSMEWDELLPGCAPQQLEPQFVRLSRADVKEGN